MAVIDPRYRQSFAEHAAPEAIEVKLAKARTALTRAAHEVQWLEALRDQRTAQMTAGTWPPPIAADADHDGP